MVKSEAIIKVQGLHKQFKRQNESKNVKEIVIHLSQYLRNRLKHHDKKAFVALDEVNFEVKRGEFFGIVGRNGSGKSTLLKILAGVYVPSRGEVSVKGSLTPFIELGVGFNPELSGKDNVYLNAALLGFNRKETRAMYDDIVEFSELSDFMDEKLRNYSSGMQVRLAFSIAIKAKSEILLIDEVLAVGDTAFQHKCINYFKKVKREGRTVVFVTHDMSSVERFCDRVLVIDKSKQLGVFSAKKATKLYQQLNAESELSTKQSGEDDASEVPRTSGSRLADGFIKSIKVIDGKKPVVCGEPLRAVITLDKMKAPDSIKDGLVALSFYDGSNAFVASLDSDKYRCDSETESIEVVVPHSPFVSGTYTMYGSIYQRDDQGEYRVVDAFDDGVRFAAVPPGGGDGSGQLFLHGSLWK
jgi:ABC-type polysaccharide/polyol phosphate transport system ATPase subunit